ncbi:MAG: hypothetical protein CVU14_09370, partial [Bacteroidetes bacterium HGW-Bacteroidetes-9]
MKNSLKSVILLILLAVSLPLISGAQVFKPVKWTFSTKQISAGEVQLIFSATIDKPWHLYSQDVPPPPDGPVPTSFFFEKSADFKTIGKVKEPKAIEEFDNQFKITLKYFADKAVFTQNIKVLSAKDFKITGYLEFMCCDDTQCLAPETIDFEFNIKGNPEAAVGVPDEKETAVAPEEVVKDTVAVAADTLVKSDSTAK